MKKVLATEKAPAAIGPYSQGMRCGDMVFISGQLPINPATGAFVGEDIASQTRQALTNIRAILESDGLTMANIVKTTVLLKNISEFSAMNEVYAEFFEGAYPARAAFEVAALPKDSLIEIEAVAYLGE